MKVSIIIPLYNSENYLRKCIGSVINQTYTDIEIILINDGSTDDTGEICREYAEKDSRILHIDTDNRGVSSARNEGLNASTGELITFIDGDDHVEADYVEYLTDLMNAYGSDIICCQHKELPIDSDRPRIIKGSEECLRQYLTSNEIFSAMWGKLFKKDLFDGISFPVGKRYEDNYVLYKLIDRCDSITIGYLSKYHYVFHNESFMNGPFTESELDLVDAMISQSDFINKKYPALSVYSNALIIYAVNRCLIKMADSDFYDDRIIADLKPLYKKYGNDFLKGKSSHLAKNFYKAARISPRLAMRIYRLLKKPAHPKE